MKFKFAVNGQRFSCAETYTGVGSSPDAGGQVYRGSYARFYAHDVRLVDSAGTDVPVALTNDGEWQLADTGVVMIDGENGGTCAGASGNLRIVGTVPQGTYSGLKFKLGLPFNVNHLFADSQPSPLSQSAMFWSWTGGYRFLRIEGLDGSKKALAGGLLHLGSTGCTPNTNTPTSCAFENLVDVGFPTFDVATNAVVLDIGTLFKDTNLDTNLAAAPGCMSGLTDPECPPMFKKLGLPYGDGLLEDGGVKIVQPTGSQTLFTME